MTNLRNFFNSVSGNNRIFTSEDIGEMSKEEFANSEQAIRHQWDSVGIPSNGELATSDDVVYVHAYTRGDGTEVQAHYRSKGGGRIGIGTVTGGAASLTSIAPFNISEGFLNDYYENLSNILHKNGVVTGGASGVTSNSSVQLEGASGQAVGGLQQGNPMSGFRARRNVNPTKDMGNCQSANVVYQARKQGYDVSALPLDKSNPVMMDLGFNPQNAYIDPSTGAPPEVKCSYSHSSEECIEWLKANIKVGESYEMSYPVQNAPMGSGHVVEVTKTKNGDLKFYDPQNGKTYNESLVENDVMFMAGVDDYVPVQFFPRIFRVDNAKINVDILNKISKPRKNNK